ncbi:MAG TPA: GNAT family acetyltransferase [Methanomicrobia archaeon]|nr:GNAT family acetyltransferase [Methanomicrobia archaeon]
MTETTCIRTFQQSDTDDVVHVWKTCGLAVPQNDPRLDIERKMAEDPSLFFVAAVGQRLVGTCMAGYDGHRGWVYYLAVLPAFQQRGIASRLMERAERELLERGCAKINLMVRTSNEEVITYYENRGYARDDVVVLGKRLIQDI